MESNEEPVRPSLGIQIPALPPPGEGQIKISLPANAELGNLSSMFGDLVMSMMAAGQLRDAAISTPEYLFVRHACWEAAIVSYSRCFEGGQGVDRKTRTRLDAFVQDLEPRLRECHERVLRYRHKRVSHHVARESGQDISITIGAFQPVPTEIRLTNVYVSVESEWYDLELLESLEELATLLKGQVLLRIDQIRGDLMTRAVADVTGLLAAQKAGQPWAPPSQP